MHRLLVLIALCCFATTAPAAPDTYAGPPVQLVQNGCKNLSQAVEQIRRQTKGRIVSAETRTRNGREVHHIKVLTDDGKVKTHKVQGCKRDNGQRA